MYFKKHVRIIVLLTIVILLPYYGAASSKTIYKWTDENGQIHITDNPPLSGMAVEIDKIEYREPELQDSVNKSQRSVTFDIHEMKKILKEYSYDKSAQLRYLKQVSLSRYMDLTTTDFIGPEWHFLNKTFDAVGFNAVIVVFSILFMLHVFLSFCFYRIIMKISAAKTKIAFVPVINIFPLIKASGQPTWWGLLLVVPFAGIFPPFVVNSNIQLPLVATFILGFILFAIVWMSICKRLGLKKWAGLLILVPIVQIMLPAYLVLKRNDHPVREKHLESATRELYFHLLSSRKIEFETGSMSISRGPVAVKLEQFNKRKSGSLLKLRVRLVHLPNFILESKRFCKFAIKEIVAINGDNVHYKEHPLEKKTGNELHFKEIEGPFVHFEAVRDVWLSKEISLKEIKSVSGELFLRLPLNIQSLELNANHMKREEYTSNARVILKDMRNSFVSLLFRGSIRNYVTTYAYGFKGRPLSHKIRSFDKIDDKNYAIKEVFKGKVDRIKVFIAENYLEQLYPFELKL